MPDRYIAFLRGINVGDHMVKMPRLRAVFEAAGFSDVESFIASGNIAFSVALGKPEALERKLETELEAGLGYEVPTFLRTPAEVAAVAVAQPFGADIGKASLYVGFLKRTPAVSATKALRAHESDIDRLTVEGREVYWLCQTTMSKSKFTGVKLENALGAATMRNITTIRKLADKYPD